MVTYKGFVIGEEEIQRCQWEENGTYFRVVGFCTVHVIKDPTTGIVYGMKHSLESAQKMIDKNEARWLRADGICNIKMEYCLD